MTKTTNNSTTTPVGLPLSRVGRDTAYSMCNAIFGRIHKLETQTIPDLTALHASEVSDNGGDEDHITCKAIMEQIKTTEKDIQSLKDYSLQFVEQFNRLDRIVGYNRPYKYVPFKVAS